MGMKSLFSTNAQFPYFAEDQAIQVSNARQQSSMSVNEEGTVLISFTQMDVIALSFTPPIPDVEFNVNRPFIAIIGDRRKNFPYVIAKITNPNA